MLHFLYTGGVYFKFQMNIKLFPVKFQFKSQSLFKRKFRRHITAVKGNLTIEKQPFDNTLAPSIIITCN